MTSPSVWLLITLISKHPAEDRPALTGLIYPGRIHEIIMQSCRSRSYVPRPGSTHFHGSGPVWTGLLWHGTADQTQAGARIRNLDMKYNHAYFNSLHNLEIQKFLRPEQHKISHNKVSKKFWPEQCECRSAGGTILSSWTKCELTSLQTEQFPEKHNNKKC